MPKAQGRSGRAEQIQLQEVPGYSRHEPVEVQGPEVPDQPGAPVGGGGVCGWGVAVEVLQNTRGQEDRRTGAAGGCEIHRCLPYRLVAGRGHGKIRFSLLLAAT
jgi:hypothetical protein